MPKCGSLVRLLAALAFLAVTVAQRPAMWAKEADKLDLPFGPNVMTALIVGAFWISLFSVGFCCLFQIQTPEAFVEKGLAQNKFY